MIDRSCGWCRLAIAVTARSDSRYCSKRCRQAAHRTGIRRLELDATDRPLRIAYADPPYPGLAARYYADQADFAGEVDHADLIRRLSTYDGWALSTSAGALPMVLGLASTLQPRRVRVAAWVKGSRPHVSARLLNAWEPVLYVPARHPSCPPARQVDDALVGVAPRRRSTLPGALIGMKPPAFCRWVFDLLGALPGDELFDLFPGSGIVSWTFDHYLSSGSTRDASRRPRADASSVATFDTSQPGPPDASSRTSADASRRAAAWADAR